MNFSFYIARRYLLSKKSTNAINIISLISVLGVFIGSAALLIILSVFNGFEGLVLSL
ncbi:MAG TPA: ABC transporter permease, partial [Anseongella sp.]|nr:ABC transporter permease [Anseongella sp.]